MDKTSQPFVWCVFIYSMHARIQEVADLVIQLMRGTSGTCGSAMNLSPSTHKLS